MFKETLRRFLGINDLLEESAKWNRELSVHSRELSEVANGLDAVQQLVQHNNAQISDLRNKIENGKVQPASAAFIDAIFKENRDRLDMVMVSLDSFADKFERSLRNVSH